MSGSFLRIVRNYENVVNIGKKIMEHKQVIVNVPKNRLDEEFRKQEEMIDNFILKAEQADKEWKTNKTSINEYWTGLS
tara:strand:+ start:1047 stop:1280 length:234 start_codon:yes stop_codon:yes gene_type:complete